jgi:hypothetical protein
MRVMRRITLGIIRAHAPGLDFPGEKTEIRVVVQAASPEAATSLADDLAALLKTLAEQSDVRDKIPPVGELAKRLAPQTAGDRITLQLTASHQEMASLGLLLLPVFRSAAGMIAQRVPSRRSSDE